MHESRARTGILVVDDHALFRDGVREILESQQDMVVVGEAGDSHTAVALAAERRPKIVLLDIEIPGPGAITTVRRVHEVSPGTAVVILSMFEGPRLLNELLEAGIRAYLLKSATRQELVAAIRSVASDEHRVVLSVSRESLAHVRAPAEKLSAQEREILQLAAEALSNKQIAARLSTSEATIKRNLRGIFAKLGAVSRIDAVNKAVAACLIVGVTGTSVPPKLVEPQNNPGRRDTGHQQRYVARGMDHPDIVRVSRRGSRADERGRPPRRRP
ncbi:response regulator transcription factor [Actinomadura sp. KC345]|uniref:response regulator transcription factor n=1 Tax=Actinomadura sp. KC345 TaxID=2530371 RepID=UPI00104AA942|nr:response regulator transcription factor [Actinomadura sp. KC345]TDC54733.1 response regulator transcription factor [Actinomadura sp. KC345]